MFYIFQNHILSAEQRGILTNESKNRQKTGSRPDTRPTFPMLFSDCSPFLASRLARHLEPDSLVPKEESRPAAV